MAGMVSETGAATPPRRVQWLARLQSPLAAYYLVLGATVALTVLGLVMVLSSSSVVAYQATGNPYGVFTKQAMFAVLAMPIAWLASRLPVRFWRPAAWLMLLVAVGLLALVVAHGQASGGNKNWVSLAGVTIQPSELAKLALVVWAATVLSSKGALLQRLSHVVIPVVPVALGLMLLVMLGNDLGTTLVVLAITAAVLWVAGAPLRVFVWSILLGVPAVAALVTTSPNRMKRLGVWSGGKPCDVLDTCYQALHGQWALASGGWWGVGLGDSRQKWQWLPAAHNDFIFAIIGEELGLAGTLAVLALFAALGLGLFRLVLATDDPFVKIATGGVLAWVLGQAIVNIGAVLGMLPIIGLPLPLVSSGGSALMTTLVALGMVLGFARRVPGAPEALAAREGVVRRSFAVLPHRDRTAARGARRPASVPRASSRPAGARR